MTRDVAMTIKEMKKLCSFLHGMMEKEQTTELNDFFKNLDLTESIDYLVGSLRYSFPYSGKLTEWYPARDKIHAELKKRKTKDLRRIMEGLIGTVDSEAGRRSHNLIQGLVGRKPISPSAKYSERGIL